jgi:hypothetical protein
MFTSKSFSSHQEKLRPRPNGTRRGWRLPWRNWKNNFYFGLQHLVPNMAQVATCLGMGQAAAKTGYVYGLCLLHFLLQAFQLKSFSLFLLTGTVV